MTAKHPIHTLRIIGLVEGISFLILLGIAMPLKYAAGMPSAVRIVGSIHGLLFVAFGFALLRAAWLAQWSIGRMALVFGSGFLPFGPWLIEKRLRAYAMEFDTAARLKP